MQALARALAARGLGHLGVVAAAAFRARHPNVSDFLARRPWARSIVVIGNGGPAMWRAFRTHVEDEPGWMRRADPLDDWTERVVHRAVEETWTAPGRRELLFSFRPDEGATVPFQRLAREAGLGVPSRLGLLIHPTFGPWLGLRAALVAECALAPTDSLGGWDPCEGCPAPCVDACAGGAMGPEGWRMARCTVAKLGEPACRSRCGAREACVVGPEHRYDADEIAYHSETSAARIEGRLAPYRRLTLGVVPSRLLLRMYFFTFGRTFSKVSK